MLNFMPTKVSQLGQKASSSKKKAIQTNNAEQDTPWKEIIEYRFSVFLQFFFLPIYNQIDWSKGYTFLDKELQKIMRGANTKRRYVDKLVKVFLKDGQERWVLLHVEIQSQWESKLVERVYIYNYRIYDRYQSKVISLVVLADNNPNWRPNRFHYEILGFEISMTFPIAKLLDYQDKWAVLESSSNPFAVVVMAHLKTLETKGKEKELVRYQWKGQLIRMLYEHKYEKEDIVALFKFIDWIMNLPPQLQEQLDQEVYDYERSKFMPYVTNIERRGIQKGLEQGRQEGLLAEAQTSVIDNLEVRFGTVPESIVNTINQMTDRARLKQLHRQAIQVSSLAEFAQLLT